MLCPRFDVDMRGNGLSNSWQYSTNLASPRRKNELEIAHIHYILLGDSAGTGHQPQTRSRTPAQRISREHRSHLNPYCVCTVRFACREGRRSHAAGIAHQPRTPLANESVLCLHRDGLPAARDTARRWIRPVFAQDGCLRGKPSWSRRVLIPASRARKDVTNRERIRRACKTRRRAAARFPLQWLAPGPRP